MGIVGRIIAAIAIGIAAHFGMRGLINHYIDQGRTEVRAQWSAHIIEQERDHATAIAKQQEKQREKEQAAQNEADANSAEIAKRLQSLQANNDDLQRALDGLQRELAAADTVLDAYRRTYPDADAPASARADAASSVTRQLFGQCAQRYAGLAKSAADRASQVIGLQDHLMIVQPETALLLQEEPTP